MLIGILEVNNKKYEVEIKGCLYVGGKYGISWISELFSLGENVPAALAKLDELLEFTGYPEWCWKNRVDDVEYFEADAPINMVLPQA